MHVIISRTYTYILHYTVITLDYMHLHTRYQAHMQPLFSAKQYRINNRCASDKLHKKIKKQQDLPYSINYLLWYTVRSHASSAAISQLISIDTHTTSRRN